MAWRISQHTADFCSSITVWQYFRITMESSSVVPCTSSRPYPTSRSIFPFYRESKRRETKTKQEKNIYITRTHTSEAPTDSLSLFLSHIGNHDPPPLAITSINVFMLRSCVRVRVEWGGPPACCCCSSFPWSCWSPRSLHTGRVDERWSFSSFTHRQE